MRTVTLGVLGFALALLPGQDAGADMGQVHLRTEGINVSESAQKAIILHNGVDEVLILGTELRVSGNSGYTVPVVRFIPFLSEPQVSLAQPGAFKALAALVKKYGLQYQYHSQSKGGSGGSVNQAVEVRFSQKMGAHDLSVIRVNEPGAFRQWVSDFFRRKGLGGSDSYPEAEGIVADYVSRGLVWFVLDAVDLDTSTRLVEPVQYRFRSPQLYYPLKTSNTFGGNGKIDLFLIAPATLCEPGSDDNSPDQDRNCLDQHFEGSTSAELVGEEHDLDAIYPDWPSFFGAQRVFLQAVRFDGRYQFDRDVLFELSKGTPQALRGMSEAEVDYRNRRHFSERDGLHHPNCSQSPDPGPCKGRFERFYFDEKDNSCKPFFWGGCQGSVPFETRADCEKGCGLNK